MSKIIVVTGASAGVGRATALHFGKAKCSLGLISRNRARLETLKKEIEEMGGKAVVAVCDMADPEQVENAAALIEKELGPIDIWINNAMLSIFSPFLEMSVADFKRATEVTYLGFVYGTHAALKRMVPRNYGLVLQVGSALAYRGIPLQSAYCGGKHAIRGFTSSVRCELLHMRSHVKITMVQMPALNTPQFSWVKSHLPRKPQPVPPIYQPEVAARAIYWACFHYRREWDLGFSTLVAILGNKVFPGFLDRYLAKHGYSSQQYNGSADPNRPNNLYTSVEGDFGAHGDFDKRAKPYSVQYWLSQHRSSILLALSALVVIGLMFLSAFL